MIRCSVRNPDRRTDEPPANKPSSGDSWKSKARPEPVDRDDRRVSSQQQQQQQQSSPSSSERWTERNSETAGSWRTVGKKQTNP